MEVRQKASSAEGAVSRRLTEDTPLRARRRASHVRGGSVSRRGLNQLARNRAHLAWAHKTEGKVKSIPSHSSGERGLGGEALLLEKRPLPSAFLPPASLWKGARGGASLQRSRLPRSSSSVFLCTSLGFCLTEGRGRGMLAKQFHRRDESPPRKAMKSSSSRGASLAESREKVQVRQGEPVKEQLGASARKAQAK